MSARSLLLLSGLVACNTSPKPEITEPTTSPAASVAATTPHRAFGTALGRSPRADLAEVLQSPDKFSDKTVLVEGKVRAACNRKGCWMELAESADAQAPGCRVTFKDYGFFVPTDSAGSQARVEAKVETKLIKPSMVAHLEEEGAKFAQKDADGSAREVRLVATGVELWR
jgi:Domain of unknown function (DUF4920)